MICVDTTFLVDLWRGKDQPKSPSRSLLNERSTEDFVVPAHAAGELLEGGAAVSPERMEESLQFLRLFRIGSVDIETAAHYARIVTHLRREERLQGRSKPDLWIAAWAVQHSAALVTRNARHFAAVPSLDLIEYSSQ